MEKKFFSDSRKKVKLKINKTFLIILLISIFFAFAIINFFYQGEISGKAVLSVSTNYLPNESLKGILSLSLKQGELIPANSIVLIEMENNTYEHKLSDLVSQSTLTGDFYAEDVQLSGNGEGYGIKGEKIIFPKVNFTLRIISDSNSNSGNGDDSENSNANNENPSGNSDNSNEINSGLTAGNEINSAGSETSSESDQQMNEKNNEEKKAEKEAEKSITGEVVAELTSEIWGSTSKDLIYTYHLENGQTAEIISSDQLVVLKVEKGVATVTTDYSETEEGFGSDYIGQQTISLDINLDALNIPAQEGILKITLRDNQVDIVGVSTQLNVENQQQEAVSETNETNKKLRAIENLTDYQLTDVELFKLKAITGLTEADTVKSELVNERLIIRFKIGNYFLENSYDYPQDNEVLKQQIELDRAKFIKNVATKLLETASKPETVREFLDNNLLV